MSESTEGIGGLKFSIEPPEEMPGGRAPMRLKQGVSRLATFEKEGEKYMHLLATAPQLWDAANELVKAWFPQGMLIMGGEAAPALLDARDRLANMVAKAVGKTDWKDVKQS